MVKLMQPCVLKSSQLHIEQYHNFYISSFGAIFIFTETAEMCPSIVHKYLEYLELSSKLLRVTR